METKVCNVCKIDKEINEYHKRKNGKYGRFAVCKECRKEISHKKWVNNENNIREKNKEYVKKHKEQKLKIQKKYREKNRKKLLEDRKLYYVNNKEKESKRVMKYYYDNKDYVLNRNIEYNKIKMNEDAFFRLKAYVRNRIRKFLKIKNINKINETFEIIGCTPEQLREHIQKQFKDGMCWEKMGKYIHLDHITPLSSAKTEEEVLILCHYTNLQPLWAEDNLKKRDKINYGS